MPTPQTLYFQELLNPVLDALSNAKDKPCIRGIRGPSLAFVLTLLVQLNQARGTVHQKGLPTKKSGRDSLTTSCLIVTPTDQEAEQLFQDLQFFHALLDIPAQHLAYFPHRGRLPYDPTPPTVDVVAQRMQTLHKLSLNASTMVVAPVQAVLQRLLPPRFFSEACLPLKVGSNIERDRLVTHLLRLGYRRVSVVEIPGEFSIRGGIIDIYSTSYTSPLRIEFLGDVVESMRFFDPATQESTTQTSLIWVLPAREYLPPLDDPSSISSEIPHDVDWRVPHLYPVLSTLPEYFQNSPIVILDQPDLLAKSANHWWENLLDIWTKKQAEPPSLPLPEPDGLYTFWEECLDSFEPYPTVMIEPLGPSDAIRNPITSFPFQSPTSVGLGIRGKSFSDTLGLLERLRENGMVLVVARNAGQVGRLLALFGEHKSSAVTWKPQEWSNASTGRLPFYVLKGDLSSGFVSSEGFLAILTEEELFAKVARHRPQQKSKAATFLSSLDDLNQGDYVVHVHHGIARYKGLRRLSVQGFESDYLVLEFAGRDTLYVPLDRLNLVQPHRGADHHVPKLDRLGGTSWAKTTARVKKGIEDMTQELAELYASREVVQRKAYSEDITLTREFEAAFEFDETPDQLRAIEDIQRDLESLKPMDRLVCGDVGYGKTEVAMRAAFKAVHDYRQVAILVPTTLLAQQHYETFCRRFAPFPVRIAVLSRFQTAKEVKALLPDLQSGLIDIVIGTHRLLQKDVQFKQLGLVIIDEEQWFGVRHKERLKQLRTQLDVLTLTATPIPRTLQMSFSGVRDLSVIDTPPPGRLAIQTQVLRFNPTIIQEAIRRELARGGQVFYIHNRVQTMERAATWLSQLVPEGRFSMAHGQMNERVLESVMLKFFHGEVDILVASAIIQSGLDIPCANTILVDRADTFGLAQLYQLRGRVGRAGDQAFAYFFFPNEEVLSTDAQKRLMAIQEFADLGSGFRIAAADLEIRGAGNLLGKQQSGNIAAVGLDLYMQMVEQAVHRMKGQPLEEDLDPTLHLNVSAFIPEDYVEDAHQRLSLYKRLSASHQLGDLALIHGETQDRYGPLPEPVERLFEVMQIRVLAKQLRLESVGSQNGLISLTFADKAAVPEAGIQWFMNYGEERLRFLSPRSCEIQTEQSEWPLIAQELNTILSGLSGSLVQAGERNEPRQS